MTPRDDAKPAREAWLAAIRRFGRPVFTTRELAALSGSSLSSASQGLERLASKGLVVGVKRGLWADQSSGRISAWAAVPYLVPGRRAYVSFLSALHFHGIIEQIPQTITVASTAHSRLIRTALGDFRIHQIAPAFFAGFEATERAGGVLMATPEKALVDCFYLAAHRKGQYSRFPELHFPSSFSFAKAAQWADRIPSARVRAYVRSQVSTS
jgi:predicted transcriptional regulator of viral defense system